MKLYGSYLVFIFLILSKRNKFENDLPSIHIENSYIRIDFQGPER